MGLHNPIEWTVERAQAEFGHDRRTISSRLRQLGIKPEHDGGRYSTKQICAAIYGDYELERIRKIREEADNFALDNAQTRRELIDLAALCRETEPIFTLLKQRVMNLPVDRALKDELCNDIANLLTAIEPGQSQSERDLAGPTRGDNTAKAAA